MSALAGTPSSVANPLTWNVFFARHPEPDLEFTEEELEETTSYQRSSSPMRSPKRSGGKRPLLWILLLLVIGGGTYAAMEPDTVMEYLQPLLGESTPEPPPPVAVRPKPIPPVPNVPAAQSPAPSTVPASPAPAEVPNAAAPVPPPTSFPPSPPAIPAASAPSSATAPAAVPTAPPTAAPPAMATSPTPLFGEGQRVVVLPNPAAPGNGIPLMQDAAGTKPSLAVPPGTVLTVLDGDLQNGGWVYSVRTAFGDKGWINETQLKLKP